MQAATAEAGTDAPRRVSEEERWISPAAAANDAPWCPKCWRTMVYRSARHGGHFWGCQQYPACDATRRPHERYSTLMQSSASTAWQVRTWDPADDGAASAATPRAAGRDGDPEDDQDAASSADDPWRGLT